MASSMLWHYHEKKAGHFGCLLGVLVALEADTIDTNADTNLHEQRRTRAIKKQRKYAYLQELLNTGEQPRHHRPAIPLNGVSRVRTPPPPLTSLYSVASTGWSGRWAPYPEARARVPGVLAAASSVRAP